ncbi:DUF6580 family putative transport protein [Terriglobus roseus]|uniref:Uncharacterized protein n=1 Tax=Terriglobus roseus TaxID=392734 RepID=A0A1H4LQJ6_9BACT|nr:DUF6580 family putative transport protein [Terriglobus roseus]SEB73000.1 hypothetical protein SAMN05443244_1682 [Terriglobus roseus]
MAFFVLLIAVLSRVVPHLLHTTGGNVTCVGAGLLYFGASLRGRNRALALFAVLAMAATDWWLTIYAYGYPFHISGYVVTWLWYAAVCLGASALLQRKSVMRLGLAALASSTSFFLLSNGMVWLRGNMYDHTAAGLTQCYVAGLPFYRNDLASTLVFTAIFFLLPSIATVKGWAQAMGNHGATAA